LAVEGLIILRGVVPSFHLKQPAQAAIMGIAGINELHNEVEVVPPHNRTTLKAGAESFTHAE
jgi:hypothetical protein